MSAPVAASGKRPASPFDTETETPPTTRQVTSAAVAALAAAQGGPTPLPLPPVSSASASAPQEEAPLVGFIRDNKTELALAMIAELDRHQLDQIKSSSGDSLVKLALINQNEKIVSALIAKQAPEPNPDESADPSEGTAEDALARLLLPPLAQIVGDYNHELYLDQWSFNKPSIIQATFQALLDPHTDPVPYRSNGCWLRQYSPESIRQSSQSWSLQDSQNIFDSAAKMNLRNFVEGLLELNGLNLDTAMVEAHEYNYLGINNLIWAKMHTEPYFNSDSKRKCLLEIAAGKGYLWAFKQLCVQVNHEKWSFALRLAVTKGHLPIVQWIMENCPFPKNVQDQLIVGWVGLCTRAGDKRGKPIFDWLVSRFVTGDLIKKVMLSVSDNDQPDYVRWLFEPPFCSKVRSEDVIETFMEISSYDEDAEKENLQILFSAIPADKKKKTALAAWEKAMNEPKPIAWQWVEGRGAPEWFLECEYITDQVLLETLRSAARNGNHRSVLALLGCRRNDIFENPTLGTVLRTAAELGHWNVVDAIRYSTRGNDIPETDRKLVAQIEADYRPPDESSDGQVVAAAAPGDEEDL